MSTPKTMRKPMEKAPAKNARTSPAKPIDRKSTSQVTTMRKKA